MGWQRMGDRRRKRLERLTGLRIWRAWNHQGDAWHIVTDDHRHGWVDHKTGEVQWEQSEGFHFDTCAERFGADAHGSLTHTPPTC